MAVETGGRHVDDGDLARLADGECTDEEQRALREHIASCVACRRAVEDFATFSQSFSQVVTKAGPVSPRPSGHGSDVARAGPSNIRLFAGWSWRTKAAAAVVLIAAASVAVPPARAWLAERWAEITARNPVAEEDSTQVAPVERPPTERAAITFRPEGTSFVVEVLNRQGEGSLRIAVSGQTTARAAVIGGEGQEGLTLLLQGLRISNPVGSTASYVITLPDYVAAVTVRIAGRITAEFSIVRGEDVAPRVFRLDSP